MIYVSLEIGKALAAMTMAIVTVLYDRDKDCAVLVIPNSDFIE